MTQRRFTILLLGVALAWPLVARPLAQSPEARLQAAINKETVDGDLKAAIEMYRQLETSSNHAVAAKALLRMGECYERLGDSESRRAYERIVAKFADQKDVATEARRRLSADRSAATPEKGLVERQVWTLPDNAELPTLSPDGRSVVTVEWGASDTRVMLHDLVTGDDRVVADKTRCFDAWLSPDGKQVACGWNQGDGGYEIRLFPLGGSPMRTLFPGGTEAYVAGWSPDGKRILARIKRQRASPGPWDMVVISVGDGSIQVLKSGGGIGPSYRAGTLRFSPDGLHIVHPASRVDATGKATATTLHIMSADGRGEVPLVQGAASENDWSPAWTPDGRRIVFASDRSGTPALWSIAVNDGRPQGEPEFLKAQAEQALGFARDGTLYSLREVSLSDVYLADLDVQEAAASSPAKRVNQHYVGNAAGPLAWSQDGRLLAFDRWQDGKRRLVVHAMDGGEEREIASSMLNDGPGLAVGWFPDNRSLLAGNPLRRVDVTSGQTQAIPKLERSIWDKFGTGAALSHDGTTVFYSTIDNEKSNGLYTVHLISQRIDTGEEKDLYQTTSTLPALHSIAVSPDGRVVAFGELQGQRSVAKVVSVDGGQAHQVFDRFAWGAAWSTDSRFLLIRGEWKDDVQLLVLPTEGGPARPTGLRIGIHFALHPDGRRVAFTKGTDVQDVVATKNLLPVRPAR